MKKSGFLLLVMALFLITTSVSAGVLCMSNPMISVQYTDMDALEIKIDVQEEVAGATFAGEIDVALSAYSIQSVDASRYTVTALEIWQVNKRIEMLPGIQLGGFAVRLKYPLAGRLLGQLTTDDIPHE